MTQELISRLQQLQRSAQSLVVFTQQLQANIPDEVVGVDSTGALRLTLGSGGLPTEIRVSGDWRRHVDPSSVGSAVLAANENALANRMNAMQEVLRLVASESESAATEPELLRDPATIRHAGVGTDPSVSVEPRDPLVIAEDVLAAMRMATSNAHAVEISGAGTAARGSIRIVLSVNGLQQCRVRSDWVSRQGHETINAALTQALHAAQIDLNDQLKQRRGPNLDTLLSEAVTAMCQLQSGTSQAKGD